ncbi:COG1361 S-layer family protein [Methanococcoides methylutens]|uniref:COG1361 S-layer family protein n=1 Tax=Methanococcoides methylutens TaxID=2226 RepID=UPI00404431A9
MICKNKQKMICVNSAVMMAVLLTAALFAVTASPAAGAKEFIQPTYEFSTNYYDAYGEPDLYASVIGDTEFERGETAQVRIVLSNRGVLYGFKAKTNVDTNNGEHAQSLKELEYESLRTTAFGIKAEIVSTTDHIDVDPTTSVQTLESLYPGVLPDQPMSFTITISDNAPAGNYFLLLPVSYEFQSQVEMTDGSTVRLGLPDRDHTTFYKTRNTTLQIPVLIEPASKFIVSDVEGELTSGQSGTINVTYTNVGELEAADAFARIIVMKPLSSDRSVVNLGNIAPGESKTASFDLAAEISAVEKNYGIDSEIKYYDEDGEIHFSDNIIVEVPLKSRDAGISITTLALAGILLMAAYMGYNTIRKQNNKK